METSVFINDGSGHFVKKDLPVEAQFSPVYAAYVADINGDSIQDILLGGNLYNAKSETGRYDSSYGTFLLGDGKGGFRNIPARVSGFRLEGEIRDFVQLNTRNDRLLIVAGSNTPVQVFRMTRP